jgi:uncharacterized Fe-S cluster protein YjdI
MAREILKIKGKQTSVQANVIIYRHSGKIMSGNTYLLFTKYCLNQQ